MTCTSKKCAAELTPNAVFCHMCGKRQIAEPRKYLKRPNNSGTVYKLQGRRRRPWVAAKSGVIIDYYERKTDALEAINALVKKPVTERYNMTFAEVYKPWKAEHFREIGPKGIEGYETAYNHFYALHNSKFRDLRSEHYQREIDKQIEKGRSRSTTHKMKQLAGQMSKWAMREEIIPTNYAQFIKLQEAKMTEKEVFSESDISKLKGSLNDSAKIILMLMYTGMRIGELFSLETENVYNDYCIGGEKTEAGKNRIIPIPVEIRGLFGYFKSRAPAGGMLIAGYEGQQTPAKFRSKDYYPLLESLGINKKGPHSTRHTYASLAVKAGVKPEILQKILGHADYATTSNIYVHADIETLIGATESLGANSCDN